MKVRYVACAVFLSLGGCGLTPPPAPPVPPLPKGPVSPPTPKLAAGDACLLQQISARSAYMKAMTDLAALHSDDGLIKGFAAQQVKDYDKTYTAAQKMAGTYTLSLADTQSDAEKKQLATLGRLYGRSFNRKFLYALMHASTVKERTALADAKKNGSTADMKTLAGAMLELLERSRVQGNGLKNH